MINSKSGSKEICPPICITYVRFKDVYEVRKSELQEIMERVCSEQSFDSFEHENVRCSIEVVLSRVQNAMIIEINRGQETTY